MVANGPIRRAVRWVALGLVLLMAASVPRSAGAQVWMSGPTNSELSDAVRVDEADTSARTHLEQVQAFLADEQWDEAVESLRQVMERFGDKVVKLAPRRFINTRDYCHLQIVALPPAGLSLYRSRVDPQARAWYEEGIARHDPQRLRDVVAYHFASSWGDDALLALGEMALRAGDPATAWSLWYQIIPNAQLPPSPQPRLAVPDTQIDLALVRSRLVLASIQAGSLTRARHELDALRAIHPGAKGRLAGRDVDLAATLATLLTETEQRSEQPSLGDWATFAGSPERTLVPRGELDVAGRAWETPLELTSVTDANFAQNYGFRAQRVAEDPRALLSYHPLVYGDLVLVNNEREIMAFDLHTGKPPWGLSSAVIFTPENNISGGGRGRRMLGVPRFTMTVHDNRLYARMGSPVTSAVNELPGAEQQGYLVCLDLSAQGRLLWEGKPDDVGWAFEGAPVAAGNHVYVGMRRAGVQPQAYVACFDALTGRLVWRQFVCGADTPAHNQTSEATHNLVTVHGETLFYSTNLGGVAALNAADGRIKWITLYPRAEKGLARQVAHFYRDLTPCIYHQGLVLVAPSDSRLILGIDAASGQLLWECRHADDAVHLLGVAGDNLIASGDNLYWISLSHGGRIEHQFPEGPRLRGYGRGLLVGNVVVWPTREDLWVFDQATGKQTQKISLAARREVDGTIVTGGNLVATPDYLLIAGSDKLMALSQFGRGDTPPATARAASPGLAETPSP